MPFKYVGLEDKHERDKGQRRIYHNDVLQLETLMSCRNQSKMVNRVSQKCRDTLWAGH